MWHMDDGGQTRYSASWGIGGLACHESCSWLISELISASNAPVRMVMGYFRVMNPVGQLVLCSNYDLLMYGVLTELRVTGMASTRCISGKFGYCAAVAGQHIT